MGFARLDLRDHRAVAGHTAHRHVVGCATTGHRRRRRPCRSTQRHIARGEVRHGFAELHRKVDRRAVGQIRLTRRLVDRYRGRSAIVCHRVVRAGGSHIPVPRRVMGPARIDLRDHRAVACHTAHCHIVGRASAGHRRRCRPGRAAQRHIARGEVRHRFAERHRKVDRRAVGRIPLTRRLVDRYRWRYRVGYQRPDVVFDRRGNRIGEVDPADILAPGIAVKTPRVEVNVHLGGGIAEIDPTRERTPGKAGELAGGVHVDAISVGGIVHIRFGRVART